MEVTLHLEEESKLHLNWCDDANIQRRTEVVVRVLEKPRRLTITMNDEVIWVRLGSSERTVEESQAITGGV